MKRIFLTSLVFFSFVKSMQRESDIQKEQQISVEEQEAIALAKIFIAKNNSANMRSYSHHLEDAVENHQHHLTNFLLTRIKKRFTGNDLTWINKKGFFKAASHNNLVALEKLVKTMSKKDRSSGLHVAARAGCVDAVRLLMQHGADSSYRAKHGKTVLATAIEKCSKERPGLVSADVEEAAAQKAQVDAAALTLTTRRLSSMFGMKPPWSNGGSDYALQELASGKIKLVRVTFPLGLLSEAVPGACARRT